MLTGGNFGESTAEDSSKNAEKKDKKRTRKKTQRGVPEVLRSNTKELLEHYYARSHTSGVEKTRKNSEFRSWVPTEQISNPNLTASENTSDSSSTSKSDSARNSQVISHAPAIKEPKREQAITREVYFTILDTVQLFIEDFKEEMKSKHSTFSSKVFGVLIRLLSKNLPVSFLSNLFFGISHLIFEFKKPLFRYPSSICGDLTYHIMKYCNFKTHLSRSEATALIYLLISVSVYNFVIINEK